MSRKYEDLVFHEVFWPRPIEFETVQDFAKSLATFPHRNPLVWEIRGSNHELHFFVGGEKDELSRLKNLFGNHGAIELGKNLTAENEARGKVELSRELSFRENTMSFKTDENELLTRSMLEVLAGADKDETLVFQLILGRSFAANLEPEHFAKPHPSFWQIMSGVPEASKSEKSAMAEKTVFAKMNASIRIGVSSKNEWRGQNLLRGLFASLRLLETGGVRLKQRESQAENLNAAKIPLHFSNRLSVLEIANLFLLPTGEANFAGVRDIHPKLMLPAKSFVSRNSRSFAESLNQNLDDKKFLNLPIDQVLKHLHVIGPTGAGKSVVLENLILSDIREGHGAVVIDPKQSLINSLCEKIPTNRLDDVVILDPNSPSPVGLNPFAYAENTPPELLAETVMTSLKALIPDFGIYTEKMLTGGILTLAKAENRRHNIYYQLEFHANQRE